MISIEPKEINTVIYHKNCSDGFGAAWAAYEMLGNKCTYIAMNYDDKEIAYELKNRTIAVLDFSFTEEEISKIESNNNKMIIIDHHKTALKIKDLNNVILNINKSGAILAWEYFHPTKDPPTFLKYIQDRDLWEWKLENSHEFSIAFQNVPKNFYEYSKYKDVKEIRKLIKTGSALRDYQKELIKSIGNKAATVNWKGVTIKLVNSPILQSEIGDYLSSEETVALIYYKNHETNKIIGSLRSKGNLDVSSIAENFGGGGHKNAAGFTLKIDDDITNYFN